MIRALVPVVVFVAGWGLFTLGRLRAERRVDTNHRGMARLLTNLQARDAILPVLSGDERRELLELVDEYYDLPNEGHHNNHKELGP